MARPLSAVPTNFSAQGTGTLNNIAQLDGDFAAVLSFYNDSAIGWVNYGTDTGSVNSLVVTLAAAPSAYVTGMTLVVKVANTNTAGAVINVNSLGSTSILTPAGAALSRNMLLAGYVTTLVYNGASFVLASDPVLIGEVRMFGSATLPANWLPCAGGSFATTTYPLLFAVIGYSFGGSGASFNVPNYSGFFPTHGTPGVTGGSAFISVANLPSHTHSASSVSSSSSSSSDSGHTHTLPANQAAQQGSGGGIVYVGNGGSGPQSTGTGFANITTTTITTTTTNIGATGSGAGYFQPYCSMQFIIRAM